MKCTRSLLALLVLAAAATAQDPLARRSELERLQRAEVAQKYARAAWPLGAVRAGLPSALALEGFSSEFPVAEDGLLVRTWRFASADGSGAPAFVLESRVAEDAPAAQEQLLDWLAGLQSAARMPSVAEAGLALGEAGFVGRSGAQPGALAWIAFVRGNVAVRVTAFDLSETPTLALAPLAQALDRAILGSAALAPGQRPLPPTVTRFEAARTAAVAGETLLLEVELGEPDAQLQWRVGGSGLGYVERDRDGRWRLHTTGPGPLRVELEVIGALGTVTKRALELEVSDD